MINTKLRAERILIAGLMLIVASVTGVIIISNRQAEKIKGSSRNIYRSNEIITKAEDLLVHAINAETGTRGFVLTGDEKFLEPFKQSSIAIDTEITQLRTLLVQNPVQYSLADSLDYYLKKRVEISNKQVAMRRSSGLEAAAAVVAEGEGKYYVDRIRSLILRIEAGERLLLEQKKAKTNAEIYRLNRLLTVLGILILLFVLFFSAYARRDFMQKKWQQKKLASFNEVLREEVNKRTAEVKTTLERITDGFVALDNDWCFTYVNSKAAEIFGREPHQLEGVNLWTVFPDEEEMVFRNAYTKAMEKQEYGYLQEYHVGYDRWFESHVYPSSDGISIFLRDITEAKETELRLKRETNRRSLLLDNAFDGIFVLDEHFKVVECNHTFANMLGRSHSDTIGIYPWDWDAIYYTKEILLQTWPELPMVKQKFETKIRSKSGHLFDAEITGSPEITGLENQKLMLFICRDISERIKAQNTIVTEKILSDTIINSLPGVFYLYNQEGKFLRWNKNFETVTGYTAEEVQRSHPLNFFTEKDKELLTEKIGNVFRSGEDSVVADFLLKSGETIAYYFTGRTIEYENQLCLMGVGIDISERIHAEEKLRVSENKYRMLFEDNPLPLWIYSLDDLRFMEVNEAAVKHYGYSREEFLAMTLKDIRPPEDVDQLLQSEKKDYRGIYHAGNWRHIKKDGKVIDVQIVTHDTMYGGEHMRLVLANDVTEKVEAEKKLLESLEAVRGLMAHIQYIREEERKSIGREIHDELGQQLTAIKMDVAWVDKKLDPADNLLRAKLKNTINLLDASNRSLRKILTELRSDIIDSKSLVDALELLGEQFKANTGIQFSFKTSEPDIEAEPSVANCLFRILQEALTNITRYANASKVDVSLVKTDKSISLSITDNGVGFETAQKSQRESFGIIGMRERVESMHGVFSLVSETGKGTSVMVSIPLEGQNKKGYA